MGSSASAWRTASACRGGPDWVRAEPYTIEAVAGGAADAETMRGPMLRALLESRFKLKAHIETEQVPAFALTVAPGGLKMKPVQATGITLDGVADAGVKSDACEPGSAAERAGPQPRRGARRREAVVRDPASQRAEHGARWRCGRHPPLWRGASRGSPGSVRVIDKTGITGCSTSSWSS